MELIKKAQERQGILNKILVERLAQIELFGEQTLPSGTTKVYEIPLEGYMRKVDAAIEAKELTWADLFLEEVYEVLSEEDPEKMEMELVQVAALCIAWIENLRKNG